MYSDGVIVSRMLCSKSLSQELRTNILCQKTNKKTRQFERDDSKEKTEEDKVRTLLSRICDKNWRREQQGGFSLIGTLGQDPVW